MWPCCTDCVWLGRPLKAFTAQTDKLVTFEEIHSQLSLNCTLLPPSRQWLVSEVWLKQDCVLWKDLQHCSQRSLRYNSAVMRYQSSAGSVALLWTWWGLSCAAYCLWLLFDSQNDAILENACGSAKTSDHIFISSSSNCQRRKLKVITEDKRLIW